MTWENLKLMAFGKRRRPYRLPLVGMGAAVVVAVLRGIFSMTFLPVLQTIRILTWALRVVEEVMVVVEAELARQVGQVAHRLELP